MVFFLGGPLSPKHHTLNPTTYYTATCRSRALFLPIPAVTGEVIQAKSGLDAFTWGFMSTQDTLATRHCSSVSYTKASYRVTMASQYHTVGP